MTGRALLRGYLRDTKQIASDVWKKGPFDSGLFSRWLSGDRTPNLRNAVRIEQVTSGRVPVASWMKGKRKAV